MARRSASVSFGNSFTISAALMGGKITHPWGSAKPNLTGYQVTEKKAENQYDLSSGSPLASKPVSRTVEMPFPNFARLSYSLSTGAFSTMIHES